MRILVAGAYGQLGTSIVRKMSPIHEVFAFGSKKLDVGNEEQVLETVRRIKPTYIINCAAYNNVNQAEAYVKEAEYVNQIGAYNLAKAAELIQATLIHISTDYVFDGEKKYPYVEEDTANPLNIYGITKYRGEQLIQEVCRKYMIIRTSWLYSDKSNNFPNTIMKLAKEKEKLNVICDHIGTPTNTEELSEVIAKLIYFGGQGIYHCSGNGMCSWYDFAKKTVELAGLKCEILPIYAKDYKEVARKPSYSVLDKKKLQHTIEYTMKDWQEALTIYFNKK